MAASAIARVKIEDRDQFKEYLKAVPAVIEKFGGQFFALDGLL